MPNMNNETILVAVVAVIALAVVLQTLLLPAVLLGLRKATRSLHEEIEDLRSSVVPLINNTRDVITRLSPKVEGIVDTVDAIAKSLHNQSLEVQSAAGEAVEGLRSQVLRIDAMLTSVLDNVDRAGLYVVESVGRPVRQLSKLVGSIKAVIETLRGPAPRPR
jgi:predicted PurR-regulated permease PerM